MTTMWNKINSPIVITIIAIVSLFVLQRTNKLKLAAEVRGVYEELTGIIEDGSSDAQKSKAIQQFAQEIAAQMRAGFSAGMKSSNPKSMDKDKQFIETKKQIEVSGIKYVQSQWPQREKIIYKVKNNSDKYVNQLKLNFEFYKQGELIDCENTWIHEIKLLEPGQEIALNKDRQLPKEETEKFKSDDTKIIITSFTIKEMTDENSEK
jgi:hypothetical protein